MIFLLAGHSSGAKWLLLIRVIPSALCPEQYGAHADSSSLITVIDTAPPLLPAARSRARPSALQCLWKCNVTIHKCWSTRLNSHRPSSTCSAISSSSTMLFLVSPSRPSSLCLKPPRYTDPSSARTTASSAMSTCHAVGAPTFRHH